MKHILLLYLLSLISYLLSPAAPAAVPLTWQVDTTRVAPVTFDAYHGETLALEAVFKAASKPLDLTGKAARLYWQTNDMGTSYWSTNATVTATNRVTATFASAMDPGAPTVRGFLGFSNENYRAAFVIRFRPSPGHDPAALPLPARTLDFATTEVLNAPYWTKAEADARYLGGGGGIGTNAVCAIVTNHVTSGYLCTVAAATQMTNATLAAAQQDAADKYLPLTGGNVSGNLNVNYLGAESIEADSISGTLTVSDFNSSFDLIIISDVGEIPGNSAVAFQENSSMEASWIEPDGTPVLTERLAKSTFPIVTNAYTKAASDSRFAPTSTAVAVASKIDAAGALGVFAANADYALVDLADGAFRLASGQIGNYVTATNVTLTLDFSAAAGRSGDCLLYIVNSDASNDRFLSVAGGYDIVTTADNPLTLAKATTNLVMFCRVKSNTVLTSKTEVK